MSQAEQERSQEQRKASRSDAERVQQFGATWIAWAPYVGVFIARIFRGRTIREFILGVMIAPTIFSMIWFSVFGSAGIQADSQTNGAISSAAGTSEALGLFTYLEQNPLFLLTSLSMIFLVWIFFVAGADAGTIVLGSMSAGGVLNPKRVSSSPGARLWGRSPRSCSWSGASTRSRTGPSWPRRRSRY